ncbi:MAG: type II toxin-antitoxin system RelE/ParE family toxin [Pseudomonadota bacterium]
MSFRLTSKADQDLISIYLEGAAMFGPHQAEAYHAGLGKTFDLLARNPELAPLRSEISPPVRAHRYGSHLIFYEAVDKADIIILTIRHAREDWQDGG